jgi:hypothetical protein
VRCRHLHRKHALDRITRGQITDNGQHECPLVIAGVFVAGLVRFQGLQAMAQKGVRLHLVRRAEYPTQGAFLGQLDLVSRPGRSAYVHPEIVRLGLFDLSHAELSTAE